MKNILMVLAPKNFRDLEYIVPRAIWQQKGAKVATTSSTPFSLGRFGYEVKNDFLLEEISSDNFNGVFFVGGAGALDLQNNQNAKFIAEDFSATGSSVGAICAAPRNLLEWGLLRGKKCTGHNWDGEFGKLCQKNGAIFEEKSVVVDGNFCTGNGPEAAEETALEFWKMLHI